MIIADLHMHGRFSRATSKDLTIPQLEKYARIKGLGLMATGDFTHPTWLSELKRNLTEDGSGILKTASGFSFVLQAEVANFFREGDSAKKLHNVILAKSYDVVDQINELLSKKGNLMADGRPMFAKYPCCDLVDDLKRIDKGIEIIPAHIWTPWFGLFGSNSGFDRIQDCFKDQTKNIFALETGLSSDPAMNWRLSQLDRFTLVSNSDSHSYWPWRIGREANLLDFDPEKFTYDKLINSLRTREHFAGTIEVDPNYGKYHYDGHRNCNVSMNPSESIKHKNICPKCGNRLTIGVLHRVEELADRPEGYVLKGAPPFRSMVPLSEVISMVNGGGIATKKTMAVFYDLIKRFGSEFNVLLKADQSELKKVVDEKLAEYIIKNREGKIKIDPGYDGEYGVPLIDGKKPAVRMGDDCGEERSSGSRESAKAGKTQEKTVKHKQMGLDEF